MDMLAASYQDMLEPNTIEMAIERGPSTKPKIEFRFSIMLGMRISDKIHSLYGISMKLRGSRDNGVDSVSWFVAGTSRYTISKFVDDRYMFNAGLSKNLFSD